MQIKHKKRYIVLLIIYISLPVVTPTPTFANEFPINTCPVTNNLFEHLQEQVDDRIEQVTANDTSKQLFTTRGNLTSPWLRNTNVWTNNQTPIDFTGMSPWNSRGGYTQAGTLITPRHIALAHHYALGVGDTVLFVASDNTVVTRTVSDVQRVLSTDISIAKLSSDVPETITHYPILSTSDYIMYLGDDDMFSQTIPVVMFDQEDKALIGDTSKNYLTNQINILHVQSFIASRSNFNETLIGGDSGNAGFVLIGDKPVLILTHYSAFYGPSYAHYKEDIQDVVDNMGETYELSTIDLNCFDSPVLLEDNFTLKVVVGSSVGEIVGTIQATASLESGPLYFSITSGNEDGALAISSSTGVITVANSALIQKSEFPRNIVVGVQSSIPGSDLTTKSYLITLATHPYFLVGDYVFNLDEHSSTGTTVGIIRSYDIQDDTRVYSIVSGNNAGIFSINTSNGAITVSNRDLLNYETSSSYELTVRAQESITPQQLFADVDVSISLNDISYDFSQDSYTFEIDELDENQTVVGSIDSDIVDSLDLDSTYYSIISGNNSEIFSIDPVTGQITVTDNSELDGNQIYNLVIGVSEDINSSILSTIAAVITVTHVDRPTLSYKEQVASLVQYSAEEGSSVSMIFELSAPYTKTIVANLLQTSGNATSGNDYSLSTTTLTFLPGEISKTVTFNALTDSNIEGDETLLLDILNNKRVTYGLRKNATLTINNKTITSSSGGGSSGGGGGGSFSGGGGGGGSTSFLSTPVITSTFSTTTTILSNIKNTINKSTNTQVIILLSNNKRDLKQNTRGDDVKLLQQFLNSQGFIVSKNGAGSPGNETTLFGPATKKALIKFQAENNIRPAAGYFGPLTKKFIKSLTGIE
jgi:Cadherin domain/Calx-beta domain/Putative peptidoglycan binding domain